MRWYQLALSALSLVSYTAADSWHTERCYCASYEKVGYVLSFNWQSDRYNRTYSWNMQRSVNRYAGEEPIGQRCDNGKCVNIPDLLGENRYWGLDPISSGDMCYTFEDRRVCSSSSPLRNEYISESGGYRHEFDPKAIRHHTLMNCQETCSNQWDTPYGQAYDICSYTDKKTGTAVPAGMKLDKHGKLKERAMWGSWYNCGTSDAPYFSSPKDRFVAVVGIKSPRGATAIPFVA